jgi:hypothetical protein
MTTRRSFLSAILAGCTAPAIVKAEILMPVRKIVVPADPFGTRGFLWERGLPSPWLLSQREQDAMNREMRRLLDNLPPSDRFQTIINDQRRPDLDARLQRVREHMRTGTPLPWRSI